LERRAAKEAKKAADAEAAAQASWTSFLRLEKNQITK
jgi:hypothetical protein